MWDKHYVGQDLTGFSDNGRFHAISRVTLVIDGDTSVTAGDDSGMELQAECPFATQAMAEAVLEKAGGYRYQTYSAESAAIDPAAELGDGVTAGGLYSVIAQIDDSGNGYPTLSAPGESELQDEYPVVGPSTQEFNRRIESVKQWAEENNKALKDDIEEAMEESGKLITGQLGGNYIVTMDPEDGKPNGWALMDTDSMETAKNIWRGTLGGIGHYSDGINSTPNVALTMDGKINASMILTGELWANLIKTGRIESQLGNVYFDLDANGGKGELAASILRGVEDGSTTTARIGLGTYIGGGTYEGLDVSTTSGGGGGMTLAIDRERGDYTLSNDAELSSGGNLTIRSQAVSTNPGGNNSIYMTGNSTTGEGTVEIWRGKRSGSEAILVADNTATTLRFNDKVVLGAWDDLLNLNCNGQGVLISGSDTTVLRYKGKNILYGSSSLTQISRNGKTILNANNTSTTVRFDEKNILYGSSSEVSVNLAGTAVLIANNSSTALRIKNGNYILGGDDSVTSLRSTNGKIQFETGGYARASIERDGSARFGDLYTNGVKVTSDREKKENVKAVGASALDMVHRAKTYEYNLEGENQKRVGIMYDEAPECIRSDGDTKAVDLYGMTALLWKAVQELEQKIDDMKEEKHGG